ncbi:MAG: hypothetical protein ACI4GW_03660 [Lachnospiraceae bacterium]
MRKADKFNRQNIGKKGKLLFTTFTFVLGISLFGCGKEENQDLVKDEGTEQSVEQQADSEEENTFSGDYTQPEEWGYSPFWLKYGLEGMEKKDLSTLTIFDCVTDGLSLNDVLHSSEFTYYELHYSYSTQAESDNIDDIINYDDSFLLSAGSGFEIRMYKEQEGDYIVVSVYNLSDESKTLAQCVEGNQFYVGDNSQVSYEDSAHMAFDIDGEYSWEYLDSLCDLLGKPDQIYYSLNLLMNTDREGKEETFEETVKKGGGSIIYDMMYQLNNGKLFIGVGEHNYMSTYEVDHVNTCYCTDVLYDYLRDETNSGALVNESNVYDFE